MEIRDPVHGSIAITDEFIPILKNPFVQRLRSIKQLGLSEFAFPGATHTRYIHSVGVMHVADKIFNKLFKERLADRRFQKLKKTFKLAAFLHDIGHAPLSHSTEVAMPLLKDLNIPKEHLPKNYNQDKQADHEAYTLKTIVDSSLTSAFSQISQKFGVEPFAVAELISKNNREPHYFTIEGINYFPILSQLVSSEMDADRMDYLLRDSYFCGVSYGHFDLDWLIDNLKICITGNEAFLGISERAVATFDDFLLSRYHMFLQVYFHYRSVCLEQLLVKFLTTAPEEYSIPGDLNAYLEHDDYFLMKCLRKSKNPYAKAIVQNEIPEKIFESFNNNQHLVLEDIQKYLVENKIEFIKGASCQRISKYYSQVQTEEFPIKVVRTLFETGGTSYLDINEATDLYEKYQKNHQVNRLYCYFDVLPARDQKSIIDLINQKR